MIMKRFRLLIAVALSVLFVCCGNTTKEGKSENGQPSSGDSKAMADTPTDVKCLGLAGNVKEVSVTVTDLSSETQESWEDSTQYMRFDEQGRVLKDRYDNLYKYDDKGEFVYGLSEKSKMKRDEKGRIVYYENRMDEEDDMGFDIKFEYDGADRMTKSVMVGWEATIEDTFTYTDDHIYPDRQNMESEDEGDHFSTVVTYTYKKFDDNGNWTEREVKSVSKHTIDGEDQGTEEYTQNEQRKILYY